MEGKKNFKKISMEELEKIGGGLLVEVHPKKIIYRYCCVCTLVLTVLLVVMCSCTVLAWAEDRDDYKISIPTDETLNESEQIVDEKLSLMKQEADALYPSAIPYAIIDWTDDTPVHSALHDFCRALPKGGDLHVHDDKVIPVSRYIQILKEHGGVYIILDECPEYGYMYVTDVPENAVLLNDALEDGRLDETQLREILVMSDEDVANGRWFSFENLFSTVMGLGSDMELMGRIYEEGFRSCCENNVFLVETRVILFGDDEAVAATLEMIRDAYYRVKDEYPDFIARIIGVSGKNDSFEKESAIEILRSVIRLSRTIKDEYDPDHVSNFIIGLDLVNEEDASKPLSDYADFFTSDEVKESGLKLYLHAGESLRMDNENVIDAYLFGAERVGHGFNLYRYPDLMKKFAEDKIVLEVCPVSNYRLGYIADIRLHPCLIYMEYNIPVVICSDDGLFLTGEPLTDDYYAAILSLDLGLAKIKELCRNAIVYSGLTDEEIDKLMEKWEADWDSFISEYAE